jgi:carbon monoxide dehydrogenase subunit G
MAEQLINEFTVNRPIEEAWPLITDLELIAPCLPGAELQEVEGDTYRGVVKVKLGAISSQFKGEAHFVERDDVNYRAVIKGAGRDTGGRGNASAEISAQAESLSPTSTRVAVTTDLHITGKVAQFGRGIMGDVSSKLMGQFADNLNTMIDEQGLTTPAGEEGSDDQEVEASTAPTSPTNASTSDPAQGSDTVDAAPDAPQVRKIAGPATEPIDLMEVGGSSILKRVAPAVIAIVVLLLLLRRRRG